MRHNDFVNYDDDLYVTENPHVKEEITRESILWSFTTGYGNNWHPLTWLSHILDCELFGLNSCWHHMSSLLFHIANTLLLFWVLKRLTGKVLASVFVNDLALVYLLLGKYELAIRNYNEALRLKPDYPVAINNLIIALKKRAEIDEALKKKKK